MRKRILLLSILLFLAGCWPLGRDFPTVPIEELRPNVTTKSQVYGNFGEPAKKGLENGLETWTYYYSMLTLTGVQDEKQLHVSFNQNGTLRNYSYSAQ
jgi:outer membrane protein assembly factor BamE (lipoprotein component of BamABCDE complex)